MADSWTTKTAITANHRWHGAARIGSKLYVNGGYSTSTDLNSPTTDHKEYDPAGDSWVAKAQLTSGQEPRRTPCVAYDSDTYVALNNNSGWSQKYSQANNNYTQINWGQGLGNYWQGEGASLLSGGKIYKFGGEAGAGTTSECWEGNVPSQTKTQKTAMPTARCHHGYFAIGTDKAYSIGGRTANSTEELGNNDSTVYEYSQTGNNWQTRTQLPISNHLMTSFGLDSNRAYVSGGGPAGGPTNATYKYEQNTNTWTSMSNMPAANWQGAGDSPSGGTTGYHFGGKSGMTVNYEYLAEILEAIEDLKTELVGDWPTALEDLKADLRAYAWAYEYLRCELVGTVLDALEDLKTSIAADAWGYEDLKVELVGYGQSLEDLRCELVSNLYSFEDLKCELKVADRAAPYVVSPTSGGLSPAPGQTAVPVNSNIVIKIRDDGWGVDVSQSWVDVSEIITDGYGGELSRTTTRYKQGVAGFSYQLSSDKRECVITIDPQADFGYGREVELAVFAVDLAGNCGTTTK